MKILIKQSLSTLTTFCLLICLGYGQFTWDDPSVTESCTFPDAITDPSMLFHTIQGLGSGHQWYLPMSSKAYYYWQYQKVNGGIPAVSQEEIKSLQPRLQFPDLAGVFSLSAGKVTLFGRSDKYYKLRCTPMNLIMSNMTCQIPFASIGSAPADYGVGSQVISTVIWSDDSAFTEWHCFKGNRQIFNIISANSTLTQTQIDANVAILQKWGFKTENFMSYSYV